MKVKLLFDAPDSHREWEILNSEHKRPGERGFMLVKSEYESAPLPGEDYANIHRRVMYVHESQVQMIER